MNPETKEQLHFRIVNQFVEREARRYPGARSRQGARERARKLHGWHEAKAALRAYIFDKPI